MRIHPTAAARAHWPSTRRIKDSDLQRTTGSTYCRGRQSLCAPQPDKAGKAVKAEPDKPRAAASNAQHSSDDASAHPRVPAPPPNWPAAEDTEFFIDPAAHYDWR